MANWSSSQAFELGPDKVSIVGKAEILDETICDSLQSAVDCLNAAAIECEAGLCALYSAADQIYHLLYRSDRELEALEVICGLISRSDDGAAEAVVPESDTRQLLQSIMDDQAGAVGATARLNWRGHSLDLPLDSAVARDVVRRALVAFGGKVPPEPIAGSEKLQSGSGMSSATQNKQQSKPFSFVPSERTSPAVSNASKLALVVGSGVPIDPELFPVEDVQRVARIDKRLDVPLLVPKEIEYEKVIPVANAVLYETASVVAKLRNTLQVGGERPSAVHLFEEKAETPTVRVVSAPKREGTVGGRPGENVSDLTPLCLATAVEEAHTFLVAWPEMPVLEILVEGALTDAIAPVPSSNLLEKAGEAPGAARLVSPEGAAHVAIFSRHLRKCCKEVLNDEPVPRIIYMSTICADMAVALKDKTGQVLVNALAFQQAECCELAAAPSWMVLGDNGWQPYSDEAATSIEEAYSQGLPQCERKVGRFTYKLDLVRGLQTNLQTRRERVLRREVALPVRIRPEEFKRQLQYWTERIAMARGGAGRAHRSL